MDTAGMPKTRAAAKAIGAAYYFTGVPCTHGHVAPRKTKGSCVDCLRVEWQRGAETRREYFAEYNRSSQGQAAKEKYYLANRDAVIARAQARTPEEKRAAQKSWKDKNVVWVRADTKARRRKHRQATPPWLTRRQKTEIRQLYQIAITMSKTTGEQYVVDHIVPLRSDVVCGLHVPWNLRVITREENLAKSNKLPVNSHTTTLDAAR
jgi:5-methylcytosine-specific restriction endonuclease McrA